MLSLFRMSTTSTLTNTSSAAEWTLSPDHDIFPRGSVKCLKEDICQPGSLFALLGNALIRTNQDSSWQLIAGSINQSGYKNGNSTTARFNNPGSFIQMQNSTQILVADTMNYCIRTIDYETWNVGTLSGRCGVAGGTADGKFHKALFTGPVDMIYKTGDANILLTDDSYIRQLDMIHRSVNIEYSNSEKYSFLSSMDDLTNIAARVGQTGYLATSKKGFLHVLSKRIWRERKLKELKIKLLTSDTQEEWDQASTKNTANAGSTLHKFLDVVVLTENLTLAAGASDAGKGLFIIDLSEPDAEAVEVCSRSAYLANGTIANASLQNIATCQFKTDVTKLELINSTLYLIDVEASISINELETLQLNSELRFWQMCISCRQQTLRLQAL